MVEPPPTEAARQEDRRRDMLRQIQGEQEELLAELSRLEREKKLLSAKIKEIERRSDTYPALGESMQRLRQNTEIEKQLYTSDASHSRSSTGNARPGRRRRASARLGFQSLVEVAGGVGSRNSYPGGDDPAAGERDFRLGAL